MAKYVIEDTTLTGIADAVRAKTGSTDPIPVTDMAAQIAAITGGGGSGDSGSVEGIVYVTFMNGDTELCKTACMVGDCSIDPVESAKIATPTKEPTESIVYTFSGGWALTDGGEADVAALVDVTEDRVVYAVYAESVREYTVNFYDDDGTTLLESKQVAYGTVPSCSVTEKDGAALLNWTPELVAVTGDANYVATWEEIPTFATSTWAKISEICEAGQAAEYFAVGDTKTITTTQYGECVLRIIGIDFDDKADGSGKAGITVALTKPGGVAVDSLTWAGTPIGSSIERTGLYWDYDLGSAANESYLRYWLRLSFIQYLPSDLRSVIKSVAKTSGRYSEGSFAERVSTDTIFVPSIPELGGTYPTGSTESLGVYPGFDKVAERYLYSSGTTHASWFTRTLYYYSQTGHPYLVKNGALSQSNTATDADTRYYVYPCFCI